MNRKNSLEALKIARKLGVTANFIAPHGEAKSSTVKQYAKDEGMNYTEFRTGQAADAGDLTGLPEFEMISRLDKEGNKVGEYKVTSFVLPAWFPREENTVVFFDEVNRGAKDILNGIFEAILDLSMKGIPMPKGCQVICAMNPPTSDYSGTLDFDDKAWLDRFVHIRFQPSHKEFMDFYRAKFGNSGYVEFLADQEGMIRAKTESFEVGGLVTPSPRSWETALKLEKMWDNGEISDEGLYNEFLFGTIGSTATLAANNFKKTHIRAIKGKDLIESYHNAPVRESVLMAIKKGRTDMLGLALQEIDAEFKSRKELSDQEALNIIELTKDLSKSAEHQYTLFKMIAHNQNCTGNCKGFEIGSIEKDSDGKLLLVKTATGSGLAYSVEILKLGIKINKSRDEATEEMEKVAKKKTKKVKPEEVPF